MTATLSALVLGALLTVFQPIAEAGKANTILVLGDSISAAYGLDLEQGWVALMQQRLEREHPGWAVVNASISGETSGGGIRRLPRLLEQHQPDIVVIELGGNDGLRGLPIQQFRDNLQGMAQLSRDAGAEVLLLAMEVPPNLGPRYTRLFRDSFAQIASETGSRASGFILEGIATEPELMQGDGIHPRAEAQGIIVDNVWPELLPLMEDPNDRP